MARVDVFPSASIASSSIAATVGIPLSIMTAGVIAYLPAIDNGFISDDFNLLQLVEVLQTTPLRLFDFRSEVFRLMSYIYYSICYRLFGAEPVSFYLAGIVLHVTASLLVYRWVHVISKQRLAAWVAGIFFACYERHHEAVMWISAANETVLTILCLAFLLLWERVAASRGYAYLAAIGALLLALFSKEAAVALVPLAILRLGLKGYSRADIARTTWPLISILLAYGLFWMSQAHRNFFVTDGHYALGFHFIPVYLSAAARVLSPAAFLAAPLLWRSVRADGHWRRVFRDLNILFFVAFVLIATLPYCFLTYSNHISSRNSYFPSVGLAALFGMFFIFLYRQARSPRQRSLCTAYLFALLALNVAYLWVKKEPQFQSRAAPTRELLAAIDADRPDGEPLYVCGFPEHPTIGVDALRRFRNIKESDVLFLKTCSSVQSGTALIWDSRLETYSKSIGGIGLHVWGQ